MLTKILIMVLVSFHVWYPHTNELSNMITFINQLTLDGPANATSMEYIKASDVSQGNGEYDTLMYGFASTLYYIAVYHVDKKLSNPYLTPWEL